MTAAKKSTPAKPKAPETPEDDAPRVLPVGTRVGVSEGLTVVRPDGSAHRIHGGQYVLDVPGVHRCGETEVEAV